MPQIAAVIPTFNAASYIEDALRSVFAQSLCPAERILADDCSTDNTLAVVDRIVAESPVPISVIRLPKNTGGPAGPLNAAIEAARSELVAVLEQDDAMRPDRLERQIVALAAYPG